MKTNVFISSTYEDLVDHRKAIWELLEKYKVNVKGMEAFGARKETPLETCLNEVSQSDIFICVIGYRFGSVDKDSGKSYTQLEYERAINEKKEILIYLINEKDTKVAIHHIDFDERREKLLNFKSILKDKHTIDTFTSAENLVAKLKLRLDVLLIGSTKNESAKDDYENSKDIVERFLLLPKTYSDRDVRLTVEFNGDAFPISKEICSSFGFSYGRTIGVPIIICKPEISNSSLDSLIVEEKDIELFFERKEVNEIEIVARLLFSDKRIDKVQADFFDRNNTVYIENPNYNPLRPSFDIYSSIIANDYSSKENRKYIATSQLIKGEGKAILVLRTLITK